MSGFVDLYNRVRASASNADEANSQAAQAVKKMLLHEDRSKNEGKYYAVWYADSGDLVYSEPTSLADAVSQVKFLKKYRAAWVEDSYGERVQYDAM